MPRILQIQVGSEKNAGARPVTYLRQGIALQRTWTQAVTRTELEGELDRIIRETRHPKLLRALFAALGDDPHLIRETLVRSVWVDRAIRSAFSTSPPRNTRDPSESSSLNFDQWWQQNAASFEPEWNIDLGSSGRDAITDFSTLAESTSCSSEGWQEIPRGGVPDPRAWHVAVWTGSEMLVFGGIARSQAPFADGGRYSPATDSWTRIPAIDSFPTSDGATAVWTGSEMIIWGGRHDGPTSDHRGARFNPASGVWTRISAPPSAIERRIDHTAVWTGSAMIVWGGASTLTGLPLDTGGVYSPSTDTWTTTSIVPAASARSRHTAVWTGFEMIVWGGRDQFQNLRTGARYNPVTNAWLQTTQTGAPVARSQQSAVWTGSRMLVWGGSTDEDESVLVGTGAQYNPMNNSWAPISPVGAPERRSLHSAVWTGSEMIVHGGVGAARYATGGRYTPASNSWTATNATVPPRYAHTAVWTGTEMLIWGGKIDTTTPPMTDSFSNHGARYRPSSDSWQSIDRSDFGAPSARKEHASVWTGAELLIWSGSDSNDELIDDGKRYLPATNSWQAINNASPDRPTPRSHAYGVWTGSEMLVFGGLNYQDPLASGSRYDPTNDLWTPMSSTNAPSAVVDTFPIWTGQEVLLWSGGRTFVPFPEVLLGWKYRPSSNTWTVISSTGAPLERRLHATVWTGTEMLVWGGCNSNGGLQLHSCERLDSGGRYDPGADQWTASTPFGPPAMSPRFSFAWSGRELLAIEPGLFPTPPQGFRFDPAANAWHPMTTINQPVPNLARAGWTGFDFVVIGSSSGVGSGMGSECRRYDPALDTWITIPALPNAPFARGYTSLLSTGAADQRLVVWGGSPATNTGAFYCPRGCSPVGTNSPQLRVSRNGERVRLDWDHEATAAGYDLLAGSLQVLASSSGDFSQAVSQCLGNDLVATSQFHSQPTTAGDGVFYLLRAVSCGGVGTYDDTDSTTQSGSRDAEINTSINRCP